MKKSNDRSDPETEVAIRWATVMLAMMLMFGSASLAAAECAWVLWDRLSVTPSGGERWLIHDAYPTQNECNSVKLEGWKAQVNKFKETRGRFILKQPGRTIIIEGEKGGTVTQHYWCLPDTIDPREKNE